MPDCQTIRDNMPLLLTESLDALQREQAHQHIEGCALCEREWAGVRQTWAMLDELPELPVPPRARQRFLAAIAPDLLEEQTETRTNVVPFHRRRAVRWLTQAAAVVIIAGGSWFAGHQSVAPGSVLPSAQNTKPAIQAAPSAFIPIAETRVLQASAVSPNIEGRPDISNLQFTDSDPSDDQVGISFDITSRWTVTGSPKDKSMVRLLSYVLENDEAAAPRSQAMKWVQKTYSDPAYANPEIASALAKVLRNDQHEGVRIRAVETLMQLPAFSAQTRDALIEALKTDPNPAVRIKAVEALANLARGGADTAAVDSLRETAARGNENTYVRVKAAEALSNLRPQ